MEFRLLGPLEVRDQGQVVDLGAPRVRTMCGLLLVHPGDLVGVERFIDELWPQRPPSEARALVRGYVSRLRRALRRGPSRADLVVTRKPGYLLRVEDRELDLHRFEQLITDARVAGRTGQPDRAVELLDQAQRLWRGEPLADVPRTAGISAAVTWLTERRLASMEERFDVMLAAGRHEQVLVELTRFVTAHPLRERPAGQLMLALYRCGRQAEALARYQRTCRDLATEVGIEPGEELRRLHERILAADPTLHPLPPTAAVTKRPTPRQLPRDVSALVGRDRELAAIRAALTAKCTARPGPVVVIHGAPGVGKTALATRAGHEVACWYPHGQLHVNLCGFTPDVAQLSPAAALGQLLRSLGAGAADIPAEVEEAAGLLRSMLTDRRVLIVLDNAVDAAHVRPLLPGSPGSAVLITSRNRLPALEGATHHGLAPLDPDSAVAMLGELVSDERTTEEPAATRRLAELCDHLPLGLRVAAARLDARPSWAVGDLVGRLTDERQRLAELAVGDLALRCSLAVSHTALDRGDNPTDRAAAEALRMLGALPVAGFSLELTAAVLGTPLSDTDRAVGRLLDAHLVEETTPGNYRMHDLIRLFAGELAADTVPDDVRTTTLTKALNHYLATAREAVATAYPHRVHHRPPDTAAPATRLVDRQAAMRWLDGTRHDLFAVVRQALQGPPENVHLGVWLALTPYWYLCLDAGEIPETIDLYREVITAASTLGDQRARACAHGSLTGLLMSLNQLDEAHEHLTVELALWRTLGDRFGEQRALGNLGSVHVLQRRPHEAIPYLRLQIALAEEIGAPIGQAFARYSLGMAHHQLGQLDKAIEQIELGLAWFEETGDHPRQCEGRSLLAEVYLDLGEFDRAGALLRRSLAEARRCGHSFGEVRALILLARACRLADDTATARHYAAQAATTSTRFRDTRARRDALAECAELGLDVAG